MATEDLDLMERPSRVRVRALGSGCEPLLATATSILNTSSGSRLHLHNGSRWDLLQGPVSTR